eukprot:1161252-Pelagomonas_calceolata.AAC.6
MKIEDPEGPEAPNETGSECMTESEKGKTTQATVSAPTIVCLAKQVVLLGKDNAQGYRSRKPLNENHLMDISRIF